MKKLFWNILKILFGLTLIFFLIYKIGISNLISTLLSLNPFYFFISSEIIFIPHGSFDLTCQITFLANLVAF